MSNYVLAMHIVELIAALAGSYYSLKVKDKTLAVFVWYLWVTVFVETFGMYGYILQNDYDYEWFVWIKNSVFRSNNWLYNLYRVVSIILFGQFYERVIKDPSVTKLIRILVIAYVCFTVVYFTMSGTFFIFSLPYGVFVETFLVFVFVMFYYRQLLKSDKILYFYKLPVFYISSGLLLWYLSVTPIFIFNSYLNVINDKFLEFRDFYLFIANISLYLCYTFCFLFTLRRKK
ncbi:hypothetical protein [Winogradskyella arenosi]|uniref:Uncharacterized protein n=1 Tax=Winogradskyella arenosi TaxID=533325 RepID=A0A368ZKF6_9FLAO|nr:hypothetical protein [Winogradskyella arenosi]RCW92768.1 hypothetical protein DFQ08_102804 [Winogradskyella arenosi]